MIDIQKVAIRRLLETQSTELYTKLVGKFFTDTNFLLFKKIQTFYEKNMRIPTKQEFIELNKSESIKSYIETQIYVDKSLVPELSNDFIAYQLQDWLIREDIIKWLDTFLEELEYLEGTEFIEKIQEQVLKLQNYLPDGNELFNVASIDMFNESSNFHVYSSGLSNAYDALNGGFALQELVMFGGRRGSGKSIVTLNALVHQFLRNDLSCAFFSIEMRKIEVYYRLMSILSGVPFLNFMKNTLTLKDKLLVADAKLKTFYEECDEANKLYDKLNETGDFKSFQHDLNTNVVPYKTKRFFLLDTPNLSIANIDHYLNMLTKKHEVRASAVDYLNIIHIEDRMDWKSQISLADSLKGFSRRYDQILMTPYQIDESGEARFAKGVLDSADRSFRFKPADQGEDPNILEFEITKIRNGKPMKFNVPMDWECVKIMPEKASEINQTKILNKYGHDSKETAGDLG